jgi:hypothetical protein
VVAPGAAPATAVALYPRLDWRPAMPPAARTLPGLAAAVYESPDWDEGPQPEDLAPVRLGVEVDVDAVLARDEVDGVVLSGWLEVPADGIYTFWLSDHPRSRLLIGGEAVSPGMPSGVRPAQLALRAGLHRFGLRSLHEHPQRDASLTWAGPGFGRQPIDPALLSHSRSDL